MYREKTLDMFTRIYKSEEPDLMLHFQSYLYVFVSTSRCDRQFTKRFNVYNILRKIPQLLQEKKITPWQAMCRLEQQGNKLKPYWRK